MKKKYKYQKWIAGVDEVGRGALAGSVITAAVILDPLKPIEGLKDSKKLSINRRCDLFDVIKKKSIAWSLGRAEYYEIDKLNILQATMLAMQRAVNGLHISPNFVFIDGNQGPDLPMPSQTVVKGDNLIEEISAASILAKVTRDREMLELDLMFPEYGFAKHKGYPTALHLKKIHQYGFISYHRRSFAPICNYI